MKKEPVGPKTPRPLILNGEKKELPAWDQAHADSFAVIADEVFAPIYPYLVQDIRNALGRGLHGLRVLEIGGGVGNMALELLKAGIATLDALDVSPEMLEKTRRRLEAFPEFLSKFSAHHGEAGHLPFEAGRFDVAFSRGSMQFWPDIPAALGEIRRVLQPNGLAFIGAGYGLSTPESLKQAVSAERARRTDGRTKAKPIPHLNHEEILASARNLGGQATLVKDGSGFWFQWFPGKKSVPSF